MLIYRGLSKLGEWRLDDPCQILRDLQINLMHTQSIIDSQTVGGAIPEALRGIKDNTPSIRECEVFMDCINSVKNFIRPIRGFGEFDNPPIIFKVVGDTISVLECESMDLFETFKDDLRDYHLVDKRIPLEED